MGGHGRHTLLTRHRWSGRAGDRTTVPVASSSPRNSVTSHSTGSRILAFMERHGVSRLTPPDRLSSHQPSRHGFGVVHFERQPRTGTGRATRGRSTQLNLLTGSTIARRRPVLFRRPRHRRTRQVKTGPATEKLQHRVKVVDLQDRTQPFHFPVRHAQAVCPATGVGCKLSSRLCDMMHSEAGRDFSRPTSTRSRQPVGQLRRVQRSRLQAALFVPSMWPTAPGAQPLPLALPVVPIA